MQLTVWRLSHLSVRAVQALLEARIVDLQQETEALREKLATAIDSKTRHEEILVRLCLFSSSSSFLNHCQAFVLLLLAPSHVVSWWTDCFMSLSAPNYLHDSASPPKRPLQYISFPVGHSPP